MEVGSGVVELSRVRVGVVCLKSSGFREVKLFDYEVTGISLPDVRAMGGDSA